MDKAPDAFRTISEVAEELGIPQHVLRFWETRFPQIKPMKRGGGRRYYRPEDVDLLRGIRHLLYGEGYTIRGVQRLLKDHGLKYVQAIWRTDGAPDALKFRAGDDDAAEDDAADDDASDDDAPDDDASDVEASDDDADAAAPEGDASGDDGSDADAPGDGVSARGADAAAGGAPLAGGRDPKAATRSGADEPAARDGAGGDQGSATDGEPAAGHGPAGSGTVYQRRNFAPAAPVAAARAASRPKSEREPVAGLTLAQRQRLQAALYELGECRRMMEIALRDE